MLENIQTILAKSILSKCGEILQSNGFNLSIVNDSDRWYLAIKYQRKNDSVIIHASWFPTDYPNHVIRVLLVRKKWYRFSHQIVSINDLNYNQNLGSYLKTYSLITIDTEDKLNILVAKISNDILLFGEDFLLKQYSSFDNSCYKNRKLKKNYYGYFFSLTKKSGARHITEKFTKIIF